MNDVTPPKGEIGWVCYYDVNGKPVFILTSKPIRDCFYLYEVLSDGKLHRLGRAKTPPELEEKYNVEERMRKYK